MKSFLLIVFTGFFAQADAINGSPVGLWSLPQPVTIFNVSHYLKIRITPTQISMISSCPMPDGSVAVATATVNIEIGPNTMISDGQNHEVKGTAKRPCLAGVPQGTLNYRFNGKSLSLNLPTDPKWMDLDLVTE